MLRSMTAAANPGSGNGGGERAAIRLPIRERSQVKVSGSLTKARGGQEKVTIQLGAEDIEVLLPLTAGYILGRSRWS